MRVLLDQECAAVAGGHQSECERNVTTAAIATGAVVGAAAGGAVGAVAGAGTGSLVAQVVAPPLCRWAARREEESEEEASGGSAAAWRGTIIGQFGEVTSYGRHQLMVAPDDY